MSERRVRPDGPIAEMRSTYAQRDAAMPWLDHRLNIYHPRHPVGRLFRRHNQDVLLRAIDRLRLDLRSMRVLDVGSGLGHWLRHLIELGADPSCLVGIDVTQERLRYSAHANPGVAWLSADGAALPCAAAAFDLALQVVALSSVTNPAVRERICAEIARVVRPGGHVFWIDRLRPEGSRLAGFTRRDVMNLFPGFELRLSRRVHPRHFRWFGGRLGLLSELLYALLPVACESRLFVLQRPRSEPPA